LLAPFSGRLLKNIRPSLCHARKAEQVTFLRLTVEPFQMSFSPGAFARGIAHVLHASAFILPIRKRNI
jgi:hypothetical protein